MVIQHIKWERLTNSATDFETNGKLPHLNVEELILKTRINNC
jgi:hypothetical protein